MGLHEIMVRLDLKHDPDLQSKERSSASAPKPKPLPIPVMTAGNGQAVNQEFYNALKEAARESTIIGYGEFQKQLDALKMIPDEAMRFQAALSAASANHQVTVQSLLASIDDRLEILKTQHEEFMRGISERKTSELTSKQKEAEDLQSQIAQLEVQLSELKAKFNSIQGETSAIENRFNQAVSQFNTAHTALSSEYADIRNKVTKHIGGAQ